MDGWIGVDFDGTLVEYDSHKGVSHVGHSIPLMVDRVRTWLSLGYDVRIFTARISDPPTENAARNAITDWCLRTFGKRLPITNVKDHGMIELWDDRAVQVEKNTGKIIGYSTRGL